MLSLGANVRVYLCAEAVDLRRSFDGLSVLAQEVLAQDPLSGHLFVFHNRRKDKLKVLYYDLGEAPRYVESTEASGPSSAFSLASNAVELHILRQAKPGRGGRKPNGSKATGNLLSRPAGCKSRTGKDWPSTGTECCVVRGRPRLRSVHRGPAGRAIEPRKAFLRSRRRYVGGRQQRTYRKGLIRTLRRGLRAGHVGKGRPGTWEGSFVPCRERGAGAAVKAVQVRRSGVRPAGANRTRDEVPPSEGNEARRDGG
jgi:hypothetical protein